MHPSPPKKNSGSLNVYMNHAMNTHRLPCLSSSIGPFCGAGTLGFPSRALRKRILHNTPLWGEVYGYGAKRWSKADWSHQRAWTLSNRCVPSSEGKPEGAPGAQDERSKDSSSHGGVQLLRVVCQKLQQDCSPKALLI